MSEVEQREFRAPGGSPLGIPEQVEENEWSQARKCSPSVLPSLRLLSKKEPSGLSDIYKKVCIINESLVIL